jgi:hypothetical protein
MAGEKLPIIRSEVADKILLFPMFSISF